MNEYKWFPKSINKAKMQTLAEWLNTWADFNKHKQCEEKGKTTEFGKGYNQATKDVFDRIGLDYKKGFKKGGK